MPVATDYTGLRHDRPHPYLIGQGEGRSVLDAVRAAKQLKQVSLARLDRGLGPFAGWRTLDWHPGINQRPGRQRRWGGRTGTRSDLIGLVEKLSSVTGSSVFASYVVAAYTQTYPDVSFNTYVRPAAQVLVRKMSSRCLAEPEVFVSVPSALALSKDPNIFAVDPVAGAIGERLRANTLDAVIQAPLLVARGLSDVHVLAIASTSFRRATLTLLITTMSASLTLVSPG